MSTTRQPVDPAAALALALGDLLYVILAGQERKHADPQVWEALGRLDKLRRDLQRAAGREPTQVHDPHGRVWYHTEDKKDQS